MQWVDSYAKNNLVSPDLFCPLRLRVTNAEYLETWRALYGYKYQDMNEVSGRGNQVRYLLFTAPSILIWFPKKKQISRQTNFVMIHGGWPFVREAGVMLIKPNVYVDFSAQAFLSSTEALSEILRAWLEWYPEKVLFGTDAYSEDTPLANWEEKIWLATRTSRQALALALTRMMRAGQITRSRAEELAYMVMRNNAMKLYGLENR